MSTQVLLRFFPDPPSHRQNRDKAEENQWISIFGRVNQHRLQVLEEQKQLLKRQENSEEHSADDIPSFTGREAGIDNLQAWAEMAQEVLQAGDDIEAMPLDDVEYHVRLEASSICS